ncbi:hypothetical protein SlsnVgp059 [Spodoptera littoralis nucleopolyhedrovirus]|uniref:RrmJ-type SAM-dependent 2'-O-MTase domain-containing protein n=1 Tax=Spodoptera littoralis nuclear polyhedrosis virus TaxID=10456 RepID=M1J497_NPVSL|nr:hypothetical protein SlsnVgp059 [Spodoptera littoralis nucleopolyhedrovirus]AGE89914.1 hypothetical protein SlsnVgp059 [Spodoptera littoralis nucleopolyhedrovirus]AYU75248.1 hypothetical protein [Spodoptera littoralis nucleopolyhedrovirus]
MTGGGDRKATASTASDRLIEKYQRELDALRSKLDDYSSYEISSARRRLERSSATILSGQRCFYKLKQINDKFKVCDDIRTYLDICGGPGQFVRYLNAVNGESVLGFGVTLRNHLDYDKSIVKRFGSRFERIYGGDGGDDGVDDNGSGDIMSESVVRHIVNKCGNRCDFVCADGAFDVTGDENRQESLTMPLIRRECELILSCLSVGGDCVVKIFDTFESDTRNMLEDFVRNFQEYHVFKPESSRVCNSERYLVCKNRLDKKLESISVNLHTIKFARKQISSLKRLFKILNNNEKYTGKGSKAAKSKSISKRFG